MFQHSPLTDLLVTVEIIWGTCGHFHKLFDIITDQHPRLFSTCFSTPRTLVHSGKLMKINRGRFGAGRIFVDTIPYINNFLVRIMPYGQQNWPSGNFDLHIIWSQKLPDPSPRGQQIRRTHCNDSRPATQLQPADSYRAHPQKHLTICRSCTLPLNRSRL